jgi:hypothetical protein
MLGVESDGGGGEKAGAIGVWEAANIGMLAIADTGRPMVARCADAGACVSGTRKS